MKKLLTLMLITSTIIIGADADIPTRKTLHNDSDTSITYNIINKNKEVIQRFVVSSGASKIIFIAPTQKLNIEQ